MRLRRRSLLATASFLPLTSGLAQSQAEKTLLLAAASTPEGFDGDALRPGTQEVVVQVYEGLTRYARMTRDGRTYLDSGKIEGNLAESWAMSADGKTWTFKLRQGVKSPFGNELTSADVEWGWNKSFFQKRTGNFIASVANVTGVKAVSKYEVAFTLSAPSSILLSCLTLYTPSIYDSTEMKKHATAEDPWALKWMEGNTAGFGAYHLESLRPSEQAVFVANPNYFRGPPAIQRVVYRAVPSGASRVSLLRAGQVQWIDRPTVQQVIEMQKDRRVKVEEHEGRTMSSVRMNTAMKPFDDVRVRRAFNYAIDKSKLKQSVLFGTGDTALSIVPPIVNGYDPSSFPYNYDPAKAKALLAEAGYANGLSLELNFSDIFWWEEQMAVQIADQLKAVGVTAKPQRITGSDMRARTAPGKQELLFFTFEDGPIVLDPVYTMALLAHSKGVSNRARYANPAMDALIDRARVSTDMTARVNVVKQAQKMWAEDAPWIMTVYPKTFEAMATGVSGWVPHPDDHERWSDLKLG